ncbi:MAG: hypothetical protein WEF86_11925 [Gemmatimonadota bacterium]
MKRSFLTVLAASSVFALGACGGGDTDTDIEPAEEIQPAPAPAPVPIPPITDTTMMGDSIMLEDTLTITGI